MKRNTILPIILGLALALSGCASMRNRDAASSAPAVAKTLSSNGYGQFDTSAKSSFSHRWFSAQQEAKLGAYRGLAEQLYYEPLGENKTVGSQVVGNEVYRIYLDTYLREARASDYRVIKDDLKSTLELKLTPRFYQCMGGDVAQARRCIQEDGKMPFTRLGYRPASTISVNSACGMPDCSDQFHVKGFSKSRNVVDDVLLDAGFYDMEWTLNTGARILFNYLLLNGFVNAL